MIIFEWDEAKNRNNLQKHGINFNDVPRIFDEPMLIQRDARVDYGEDRWIGIGVIKPRVIVVIYTEHHDDIIRIISARKATKTEVAYYEANI